MAIYYIDNAASGANNGTSWTDAWLNFTNVTGVVGGDTVWISGGTVSKTYTTVEWLPRNGTEGNPILYQISPEAGHNGFVDIVVSGSPSRFIRARPPSDDNDGNWMTVSGEYNGESRMKITAAQVADFDTAQGLVFKYMQVTGYFRGYDSDSIEIDHVEFLLPPGTGGWQTDAGVLGVGRTNAVYPTGYTRNSVHHCVFNIRVKNDASGLGDDAIKNVSNISIYNNSFIGVYTTYTSTEHNDGIQTAGPHVLVYNNYFEGIYNYPMYLDFTGISSRVADVRVYNNVFYNNPSANIAMGNGSSTVIVDDVIIANNTIVNGGIGIGANDAGDTYLNTYVVNNLIYNTPTATNLDVSITASNNTDGTTTNIAFVNPVSDFHLQAGSTAAIDQGISPSYLTDVFTTDADGNARTGTWDIGAYEYQAPTSVAVIGRVLRWMELAALVTGIGWHLRKPIWGGLTLCLAGSQSCVKMAPKSYDTLKVVGRGAAIQALTVFNHLTKPKV